ncbi:MAG TPA: winged helix-turn-helix domain-containing protein, partial [Caulobacteraceae bacterium]|nr:winged helix-turn-helix domain-containing protein [Caulobacteraceae bacterium]
TSQGRIDLAREPDFDLGGLRVRPSRREVSAAGTRQVLQPRVMQVLVALARSPNAVVSQRELINRCWSGLTVSDDAIGRCIGQLRRLATAWAEPPPFAIETIPGVGYRINPRALESGSEVHAAARPRPTPWLAMGIATAVAAVIGLAAWWFGVRPNESSRPISYPTIAVTPFQAADGSQTAKTYAASLTGEVSDAVSRYNLVVIKPAFGQPGAQANATSASGADFLVTGRVLRRGDATTITSDLVDAHRGVVVYSFDVPLPSNPKVDVAAEIAARIARSLDPTKLTTDMTGKLTPSEYTLVARANDAIDRWDLPDVMDQMKALAVRHPDDGDLRATIAICAIYQAQAAPPADRPALIQFGRESMAKAAILRPDSPLLHIARQMLLLGPLSWAAQERELRRAIQVDPNLHVTFNSLGGILMSVGRTHEGVALVTRSIELDPMSEVVITGGARDFVEAGARNEALDALSREEAVFPDHAETARYIRYRIALYTGAPKDLAAVIDERPDPTHMSIPAAEREAMLAALKATGPGAVRRLVAECFANYGRSSGQVGDEECLLVMVERGDLADAFRFAELAYPDHRNLYPPGADAWLINPPLGLDPAWLFTPKMKPFRDDPRFWNVAVRAGLVDYWRSTGAWPDMCQAQLALCQTHAAAALAADRPASHSA